MSLVSRLSLVTGGGSGIGRAVCQLFAKEGASVAVAGNILSDVEETVESLQEIARSQGHSDTTFCPVEVDVTSSEQVKSVIDAIPKMFSKWGPPLSVAVNGAGIIRPSPFLSLSEEMFDDVINVNLKGTFLVTQAAARYMVEKEVTNGSIVNIASITGKTPVCIIVYRNPMSTEAFNNGIPLKLGMGVTMQLKVGIVDNANYAASKGGVMALTLTAARELGRYGIRCNALLPGPIQTTMISDNIPQEWMENVLQMSSLGRVGQPQEVAELCVFLASDKSSFITGSCIEITGGLNP